MTDILEPSNDSGLAPLRDTWPGLSAVDRAVAVRKLNRSGISKRKIAQEIGVSESLIRHTLKVLLAPAADIAVARKGKMSTNKLVQSAKAAEQSREAQRSKALAEERQRMAAEGAKLIYDWLEGETPVFAFREQIVKEARETFILRRPIERDPKYQALPDLPTAEIIARCKPPAQKDDEMHLVAWLADWLIRWVVWVIPDQDARDKALLLALARATKQK